MEKGTGRLNFKTCVACTLTKSIECFGLTNRNRSGYLTRCKVCLNVKNSEWRKANPEKAKAQQLRYVRGSEEKVRQAKKNYIDANREKAMRAVRKWQSENPHKVNAATARRYASKTRATPSWASSRMIDLFYFYARWLTAQTGVPHHVDHIVPLRSKWVCGLHVEFNLQILTGVENVRKNNSFRPWQDC